MRIPLLPLTTLLVVACSTQGSVAVIPHDDRTLGDAKNFYGSAVTPWAVVRDNGSVAGVGFSIPFAAIQSARTELRPGEDPEQHDPSDSVRLDLPEEIHGKTSIDHIDIDYAPIGHPPVGIYDVPHFDAHFYRIGPAEQARIDCSDDSPVDSTRLPEGFVLTKPGRPPRGECISLMGHRAFNIADRTLAKDGEGLKTATMVLGYYINRLTFIEPMIARSMLLNKKSMSIDIPRPAVVDGWTQYPAQANIVYDRADDAYDVWLEFPLSDAR